MVVLAPVLETERNQEYHDLAVSMEHSKAEAATVAGFINHIFRGV